jgi:hypothetical protein
MSAIRGLNLVHERTTRAAGLEGWRVDETFEMDSISIPVRPIASGAIFGAALTVAGVYSPSVIIAQMHFQDFHMMKSFVAASACSA